MAVGNWELARDIVPPSMPLPVASRADDFVMGLWNEMRSSLAQGCQLDLLRWRCEGAGLSELGKVEVWDRCRLVNAEVEAFIARLAGSGNG